MTISQIVNENQLDSWVRGNAVKAQGIMVELVKRLVCISCPRPPYRRFPLGDSTGQHGPDGELETAIGFSPFIPEGKSIWQIGTNIDARKKANSDYNDSTKETPIEVRRETTFIFVTPLSGRRDWRDTWKPKGIQKWLEEKKTRKDWKEVQVIDGTQLTDWISQFPAVGHWLGAVIGQLPEDFDTAEYHWQILSGFGAPPPLIPELFTTGRELASEKLRQLIIDQNKNQLRLDTRFPQHPKDFVSAYVASLPDEERIEHQNRVLILNSAETFKKACSLDESHVFVIDFDLESESGPQLVQRALQRRHAIIYSSPPGGPPHGNTCELLIPNIYEMKKALIQSGYSEERARWLTNRAGRDLNTLLRLIQNLSALPEWATKSEASDLAIAQLIGQWHDESAGDQEIIGELSGKSYGEWIVRIRKAASDKSAPLEFINGRWKFISRYEPWLYLGKLIGPEVLEKFERLTITVLSETDTKLDLPKEKRHAVAIYGRKRKYSNQLREGIAETLALLSSYGESLAACPVGRPQQVASRVVNELLGEADSRRWASLNDVLPLLAEASPDSFLSAVGGASEKPDEPFSGVFSEEGDVFFGGSFVTGLLWALESLAWSEKYLTRACSILANLAVLDPGGQWSNRPANSIITILLPWYPQTAGSEEKRHATLRAIVREHPDVAWKLVLELLPKRHSNTSGTHRPKWCKFIPEDWKDGASYEQRWRDEAFYADLALELAGNDPARLEELLQFYFNLNPNFSNFAETLRVRLKSDVILGLPDDQRLEIWIALKTKIENHRKYADSDVWDVPAESLDELESVAEKLKPEKPKVHHKRLFSGRDFDLYEKKGNWEEQRNRLQRLRIDALREILDSGSFNDLMQFWRSVELPHEVGDAYGADTERADDIQVLPQLLESDIEADYRFAVSYVFRRFQQKKWDWVDNLDRSSWSMPTKAKFFAALPFEIQAWDRVSIEMAGYESEYWKIARVYPDRDHPEGMKYAIDQLIKNGRSDASIQCFWLGDLWGGEYSELGLRALEAFSTKNPIDAYAIEEVFTHLQMDELVDLERLAAMEVKFLGLLNKYSSARPRTLYRFLAERSGFFCEVIRMVFRSSKEVDETSEKRKPEVDEKTKMIIERAYDLLMDWDYPPGRLADGKFDGKRLYKWVQDVKKASLETGHWEAASHQIGQVLFYTPCDENGLWLEPVCELLDSKHELEFRRGLCMRIINSRGAYWFSGGKEEVKLAEKWEGIAEQAEKKGFSRLAISIRELGTTYRAEANRSIQEQQHRFD